MLDRGSLGPALRANIAIPGLAVDRTRQSGEATPPNVRTRIWTVESGLNVSSLDSSAADELIARAYDETIRQLGVLDHYY